MQQVSITKISWSVPLREITTVFSPENPTKTINTELSAQLFIIITGSTYTYYWALKG
jgi:hypothetical protein